MGGNHTDPDSYQSRTLFECKNGITLHSIPHTSSVFDIHLSKDNEIWSGSLEFKEQEQLVNSYMEGFEQRKENEHFIIHPFIKMRSKLEFKNRDNGKLWAETWFLPIATDLNLSRAANYDIDIRTVTKVNPDGTDTIQQISDTTYKVIVELPNSGLHPHYSNRAPDKAVSYVALGLKFKNARNAAQFEYMLNIFEARFKHRQQQYYYDRMVYAMNILNFNTIIQEQDEEDHDGDEDDNKEDDIRELTKEFSNTRIGARLAKPKLHRNGGDVNADDDDDDDDDFGDFIST
ncbi:hypothetical protein Cantr_09051 [Candida viswanathii]|uniref:Uncharacterized protein n=1 Tax=Candida viswanathii TaxID=5486 RepID=A0A367Y8U2_9ASCO|nr:hypothetical protein Cantr_09051 [Candida viswanathii]